MKEHVSVHVPKSVFIGYLYTDMYMCYFCVVDCAENKNVMTNMQKKLSQTKHMPKHMKVRLTP